MQPSVTVTRQNNHSRMGLSGILGDELAEGTIGLIEDGDLIRIDIPNRTINGELDHNELNRRREKRDDPGWQPLEA